MLLVYYRSRTLIMEVCMIQIENLNFGYGKELLFDQLGLKIEAGSIYGFLGRNGAGKTSLLRIISGQLYPREGVCTVMGENPGERSAQMLSDMYFIPEEFYIPAVKPEEYTSMYAPFYPRFDLRKFDSYSREFELPAGKKLSAYSYGQKKKFLIAFGLATGCSLLLLDEPTNGLDIPSKSQFRRLVASAMADDQTFIVSTHQVRDMENLIDPIVIVDDGTVIFNQSLETVSRKVAARVQQESPDDSKVLYSEKVLGGYSVIVENTDGEETSIDLELLFNAVVSGDGRLRNLFKQGGVR